MVRWSTSTTYGKSMTFQDTTIDSFFFYSLYSFPIYPKYPSLRFARFVRFLRDLVHPGTCARSRPGFSPGHIIAPFLIFWKHSGGYLQRVENVPARFHEAYWFRGEGNLIARLSLERNEISGGALGVATARAKLYEPWCRAPVELPAPARDPRRRATTLRSESSSFPTQSHYTLSLTPTAYISSASQSHRCSYYLFMSWISTFECNWPNQRILQDVCQSLENEAPSEKTFVSCFFLDLVSDFLPFSIYIYFIFLPWRLFNLFWSLAIWRRKRLPIQVWL